jgi:glutamate--cysteine ligase
MMRLSASLQVNLDFGGPEDTATRWSTANSLTPLLTAMFANSPATLPDGSSVADGRWWIWRQLDPSRTGRPGERGGARPAGDRPGIPPWKEYLKFALTARVVFDAETRPVTVEGEEAPRFTDWWLAGGEDEGPTEDDWRAHLGTLFPDVRPRRWMEIRAIDVPERRWWPVPPTVLSALLYDDRARAAADELLAALSASAAATELSDRAIRKGLGDPELAATAGELFRLAEGAMDRFPDGWFGPRARTATAEFRERYVDTGRTQADEARENGEITRLIG